MKKQALFGLWAGLFIVCAGLGFIPEPEGSVQILLTILSLLLFLPRRCCCSSPVSAVICIP